MFILLARAIRGRFFICAISTLGNLPRLKIVGVPENEGGAVCFDSCRRGSVEVRAKLDSWGAERNVD